MITVKELKRFLEYFDDETLVVVPTENRSYRRAFVHDAYAVHLKPDDHSQNLAMYSDNSNEIDFSETPNAQIICVVVVT